MCPTQFCNGLLTLVPWTTLDHIPSSTTVKGCLSWDRHNSFLVPYKFKYRVCSGWNKPADSKMENFWLPDNYTCIPLVALQKDNVHGSCKWSHCRSSREREVLAGAFHPNDGEEGRMTSCYDGQRTTPLYGTYLMTYIRAPLIQFCHYYMRKLSQLPWLSMGWMYLKKPHN